MGLCQRAASGGRGGRGVGGTGRTHAQLGGGRLRREKKKKWGKKRKKINEKKERWSARGPTATSAATEAVGGEGEKSMKPTRGKGVSAVGAPCVRDEHATRARAR